MFMDWKAEYCYDGKSSQSVHGYRAMPFKTPGGFMEVEPKIHLQMQGTLKSQSKGKDSGKSSPP